MSTTIRIPEDLIETAKIHANIENRSLSRQLVHWAKIGKLAEENSKIPYDLIKKNLINDIEDTYEVIKRVNTNQEKLYTTAEVLEALEDEV